MAKNTKTKRTGKKYDGLAALKRRAEGIIVGKGHNLAFLGGAVLAGVTVINMERMVTTLRSAREKEDMVVAIQDQLRFRKRKWTLVYGFLLRELDDEGQPVVGVLSDWFYVDHATAGEMDNAATSTLADERRAFIEKMKEEGRPASDLLGTVYVAIPADVKVDKDKTPDDILQNIDEHLEEKGFFDIEKLEAAHTMNRLKYMDWERKNGVGEHEAHASAFMTTI